MKKIVIVVIVLIGVHACKRDLAVPFTSPNVSTSKIIPKQKKRHGKKFSQEEWKHEIGQQSIRGQKNMFKKISLGEENERTCYKI